MAVTQDVTASNATGKSAIYKQRAVILRMMQPLSFLFPKLRREHALAVNQIVAVKILNCSFHNTFSNGSLLNDIPAA